MPRRKRSLSNLGCELFNIGMEEKQNITCLRSLVYNLFTTDFDEKILKSLVKFRNSTYKLFSFLNHENIHKIPLYFNNAAGNLIYLIFVDEDNVNNLNKIKKNINFYYYLAEAAMKNNDHNTAILIRTALDNVAVKRLHLKKTKKQKKIIDLFIKRYGSFINCNSNHLKEILDNQDINFLPSVAILLMHYNKNKEYYKCYTKLGKLPKKLADVNFQLERIVRRYYHRYKNNQNDLQKIYLYDTNNFELLKKYDSRSCDIKLIELSKDINNKK